MYRTIAICGTLVAVVIWLVLMAIRGRKSKKAGSNETDGDDISLIETQFVPKRKPYEEDPDEESECGDMLPLEDAEGLFDPQRPKKERLALAERIKEEGFKGEMTGRRLWNSCRESWGIAMTA